MNDDGRQTSHPSCARRFHALSPAHRSRIAHHYAHHALNGTTRAQMDELVVLLCDERRFRPGSRTQAKAAAAALAQCFRNMGFPDSVTDWGAANATAAYDAVSPFLHVHAHQPKGSRNQMVGVGTRRSLHAAFKPHKRMAPPQLPIPDCICAGNHRAAVQLPLSVEEKALDAIATQCRARASRFVELKRNPGNTCSFIKALPRRHLSVSHDDQTRDGAADPVCSRPNPTPIDPQWSKDV